MVVADQLIQDLEPLVRDFQAALDVDSINQEITVTGVVLEVALEVWETVLPMQDTVLTKKLVVVQEQQLIF
jgi:hypothetical protein